MLGVHVISLFCCKERLVARLPQPRWNHATLREKMVFVNALTGPKKQKLGHLSEIRYVNNNEKYRSYMSFTQSQAREIQESLSQIGISKAEQAAYMALLGMGVTTATPLAQALSIPLTTAQSLLKRLANIGVVHVTKRKSRSVYEAKDPQILKGLLEQRLQEVTNVIPLLKSLRADPVSGARIRIYTRERVSDIFKQALLSKEKIIYEIVAAKDLQDVLGERFHFSKRRVEQSVHLKSLRVEKQETKKYNQSIHQKELREARFLPREFDFTCSILFWDTTIAFITPGKEGLAWMVQSTSFVTLFKQLFDVLWSVSRKMETL
jgi:sugar-specific transcriptional regulator TrmB